MAPDAPRVTLRRATPDDAPRLRRWDAQPHVAAAGWDPDWDWDAELARAPDWRALLVAEVDGRPVGVVQIIDPAREETRYWGEVPTGLRALDIWIGEASDLGRGYGTAMMQLALATCFAAPGVSGVWIDPLASNTRAHRFYERLGFRFAERRRLGDDECLVYHLNRADFLLARTDADPPVTSSHMGDLDGSPPPVPGPPSRPSDALRDAPAPDLPDASRPHA